MRLFRRKRELEKARIRAVYKDLSDDDVFTEYHVYKPHSQYTQEVLQELGKWDELQRRKRGGTTLNEVLVQATGYKGQPEQECPTIMAAYVPLDHGETK